MDELREKIMEYLHRHFDGRWQSPDFYEVHTVAMACAFGTTCAWPSEVPFHKIYTIVSDVVREYMEKRTGYEKLMGG